MKILTKTKPVAWVFFIIALLTAPVWGMMLFNNYKAYSLSRDISSADLPKNAKLVFSTSQVKNTGNGDGCDYLAFAIVEYWGKAADLQSAFLAVLQKPRYLNRHGKLHIGENKSERWWSAKIKGLATSLTITPNADHAGHYLLKFIVAPRAISTDLRCW